MFESLIITLREGIEAALAIGIIMVYLRRQERAHLARWVVAGLWAAVAASLAAALALESLDLSGEMSEGIIMLAAAALVITMVVWMARHARALKGEIERKVESVSAPGTDRWAGLALFGLAFLMVFREGVETVLLLAAVRFDSSALLSFLGGIAGLTVAVLFYIAFVRGSLLMDLGRFFKVTAVVLIVFAAQLVLGGIHELGEAGAIPLGRIQMQLLGPIVKSESLFLAALLTLPLVVMLIPASRKRAAGDGPSGPESTAPERRQALAALLRQRRWRAMTIALGLLAAISLTGAYTWSRLPRAIEPPILLEAAGGEVRVSTAGLDDGHLHRYGVMVDGTVVRFFVMVGQGNRLQTCYDACEVCGADGYIEEQGRLICITCAADIVRATVGRGGGCNPIPLKSRIEADEIRIAVDDLATMRDAFRAAAAESGPAPPPSR